MKNLVLTFIFFSALIVSSCREDADLNGNVINPSLGGIYTEIEGNLSGTLNRADSPYLVKHDITVPAGDTLFIERGIFIYFDDNTKMTANGLVIAEGTKQEPIVLDAFMNSWFGVSVSNSSDTTEFKFCVFRNVYQKSDDPVQNGAVFINNTNAIVENCIFISNTARYGGGISINNSSVIIKNNIFQDNDAEIFGGALYALNSTTTIINNTIFRNSCFNFGGGIVFSEPVSADVQNNIFFKNFSFAGDTRIALKSGDSTLINQQYNYLAFGSMDPLFFSTKNLHLTSGSPCIDAGNPDPKFNDVNGTRNDQGAYGGPLGDW